MNLQDHWDILRFAIFPIIAGVTIISILLLLCHRIFHPTQLREGTAFIPVLGLLGGVVGICTGASRVPVVGSVLPAFLTFMTALCGYAFAKEGLAKMRHVIPYSLTAMLVSSVYFSFVGSQVRFENETFARQDQRDLLHFERVDLELEKAQKFKEAGFQAPAVEFQKPRIAPEPNRPELTIPQPR